MRTIRTRRKGYEYYGFEPGEDKRLKKYCSSAEFDEHILLLQAAIEAHKEIAPDLFYSIAKGMSYEDVDRLNYIPITKGDFYGHQRNTLYIFRDMLRMIGKW